MDAFAAIADPTRRGILKMLESGPQPVGTIAARFAISGPAISQHLKTLRDAQLVQVRIDSQRRIYSLDLRGFQQVDGWLSRYRSFWKRNLDALEAALRADARGSSFQPAQRGIRSPKRKRGRAS